MDLRPALAKYRVGLLFVGIGVLLIFLFSVAGFGPIVKLPFFAPAGTSEFAIFYLMAQLIERVLEPLSETFNEKPDIRAISMWGAASMLGMVLSYGTLGLFQVVGVTFLVWPVSGNPALTGHPFDAIFSGLILGGGTKPLHDLISYIQCQKEEKQQKK